MIRLSSAELLFENQPVYRVANGRKNTRASAKKMLLVYENDSEQLPEQQRIMLEKLVSACHLQTGEAEYLNIRYQYQNTSLGDWKNIFSPEIVLVFGGIPLSRNILGLKKNTIYTFEKIQVLSTETLEKLSGNDKEKGALWSSLKKCFNI